MLAGAPCMHCSGRVAGAHNEQLDVDFLRGMIFCSRIQVQMTRLHRLQSTQYGRQAMRPDVGPLVQQH